MKYLIIGSLLLLISFNSFGQAEEDMNSSQSTVGPWTIGGNFRYATGNSFRNVFDPFFLSELENASRFQFNPVLTYGITNRFSANLLLGTTFSKQKGSEAVGVPGTDVKRRAESKENSYLFGVSVDRYFVLTKIWGFRLELGATYESNTFTRFREGGVFGGIQFPEQNTVIKGNTTGIFFTPNVDFFVGQRINLALNFGNVSYLFNRQKEEDDSEYISEWDFQFGVSPDNVGLGIEFNF